MTEDMTSSIASEAVSTQAQDSGEGEHDQGGESLNATVRYTLEYEW